MHLRLPRGTDANSGAPTWPAGFEPHVVAQAFGSHKLSAFSIILESWRRGLSVKIAHPQGFRYSVSDGAKEIKFYASRSYETTSKAVRTVDNKYATIEHMRSAGVPTPNSRRFVSNETTFDELLDIAKRDYVWPIVIKPITGSMGKGVFANIATVDQLREAYEYMTDTLHAKQFLLEQHVSGDDYRIYVVGDKAVAACRRIPANVVGDGKQSVKELIKSKNRIRKQNPFLSKGIIRIDHEIDSMIDHQGLSYSSVPKRGQYVQLRQKANASAGGDVEDVTGQLPDDILAAAVAAVQSIDNLAAAGVDVLFDPKSDNPDTPFAIIELNARAHIPVNMYPTHGHGQDVPRAVVDHFFPESVQKINKDAVTLGLNLDSLLTPLRDGSASEVKVATLPGHCFPVREKLEFNQAVQLTPLQKRNVLQASRKFGVSGSLENTNGGSRLIVAGEEQAVQEFLEKVASVLKRDLPNSEKWGGLIMLGFYFSDTPLLRTNGEDRV